MAQPDAFSTFVTGAAPKLSTVHRHRYPPPAVRRVGIPKDGKASQRPLGVPGVADRARQRGAGAILVAIAHGKTGFGSLEVLWRLGTQGE